MEWVKLYTTIHDDPKVARLSDRAFRGYIYSLSWSGLHNRDGEWEYAGKAPKWVAELEAAGFFHATGDCTYRIHGWEARQIDYEELRVVRREAGRLGGVRSGEARRSKREASASSKPEASTEATAKQTRREEKREEETRTNYLAPRKRDAIFETIAEVCGIDWQNLTGAARGALNKAAAELRGVGATPDAIRERAANWPYDVPLTPPGLAKHWPALTHPRATLKPSTVRQLSRAQRLEAEGL